MKELFRKKNEAFTLIETLVAVSIFTISVLAVMSVLASGISYTNNAKKKMIASFLAQEGIEYIRNMRDTKGLYLPGNSGWAQFNSKLAQCDDGGTNACYFDPGSPQSYDIKKCASNLDNTDCKLYLKNGIYNYDKNALGTVDSGFTRKIWKTDGTITGSNDEVKIFSKVEWTQGSGMKSVTFSANLFNLNP